MLWNYNAIKLMIGWARHPKYRLFLAPMCTTTFLTTAVTCQRRENLSAADQCDLVRLTGNFVLEPITVEVLGTWTKLWPDAFFTNLDY